MNDKLLGHTFLSVVLVAGANWLGLIFSLYWTAWWFDYLTHFLGGVAIAFLSFWIFKKLHVFYPDLRLSNIAFVCVFFTLIIGIGWEVFEYVNGLSLIPGETYWKDTSHDMVADVVGALFSAIVIWKKKLYE